MDNYKIIKENFTKALKESYGNSTAPQDITIEGNKIIFHFTSEEEADTNYRYFAGSVQATTNGNTVWVYATSAGQFLVKELLNK